MSFYQRGNSQQTDHFVDTMDALQALIDEHGAVTPITVGDLNVQLPQKLVPGWHKTRGFNKHGAIMYDYITYNDYIVADFIHKQSINYNYFCDGTGVQTWMDHCLSSANDASEINTCDILPDDESNVSDHLPIRTTMTLIYKMISCDSTEQVHSNLYTHAKWDNYANKHS